MIAQLSLAFLLTISSMLPQSGKTNFSGRWQFNEAQSTSEQSTKVIKDIPPALQAKIPYFDVPRFAAPARFYTEPPVVNVKHIGSRLTISAPSWFNEWLGGNNDLIVDGKEKTSTHGGENAL